VAVAAAPGSTSETQARPQLALGWDVVPGKVVAGHNGAITFGPLSCMQRLPRGITTGVNFNRLPFAIEKAVVEIGQRITGEIGSIVQWPDIDLYAQYG